MRKKEIILIIVLLLSGFFFINIGSNITGAVAGVSISSGMNSFFVIIFIFIGLLLTRVTPREKKSLEIMISNEASKKATKDKKIRNSMKAYRREIDMIKKQLDSRPQESLGDFRVSPRGHKDIRVAWHYDPEKNILYIDDLLSHRSDKKYKSNWASRAKKREITLGDYTGYEAYAA